LEEEEEEEEYKITDKFIFTNLWSQSNVQVLLLWQQKFILKMLSVFNVIPHKALPVSLWTVTRS